MYNIKRHGKQALTHWEVIMKLKSSIKWAIAAVATMTTVAVSVSIANAYTYNWDATSGGGYGIFGDDKDQIGGDTFREGYDFEFSEENSALKQAVSFELSVDIQSFYSSKTNRDIPAQATISFGGYDENGKRVEIGKFEETKAGPVTLTYSLVENNADSMASGKFWMELEPWSYSKIEFKSIKFYDKHDHCILYGYAQDTSLNEQYWRWYGQWTFYQLDAPALEVEGIQNADGTYELNADVSVSEPTMIVKTSNEANENICGYNTASAERFLNGEEITGAKSFAYNSAEGANNKYSFVTNACVVLEDSRYNTKITLYSVGAEKTVTIGKLKIEAGKPQLLGELPTISYGDFESPDKLLESLNNATRDPDFTAPQIDGAYVDSSVKDDTAPLGRALITGADGSSKVIAKVVYDEVSGFDPASHKAQTITLKAHVEANEIEFLNDNGTVFFEEQINCSADYIDSVKISKQPRTDYEYREGLDLSGGELTITYNSGYTETVSMTDARVSASGFYGANGEFPAYNSEVNVTVTYTAEDGVYDPDRADGAKFSVDFTAKIKDIPALDAPAITPDGGKFRNSCKVSITAQEGASVFYTTDGTDPTADSSRYTAPFTITNNAVVKAIAVKEGCYNSEIATAEFTKLSGGNGGGGTGGSSRPTTHTEPDYPTIGGSSKSWSDIAADLEKLANGSEFTIQLNGNTSVPVEVIKAIGDKKLKVHFTVDSSRGWFVDGAEITAPAAADFSFIRTASQKHDGLRGIEGIQFIINNAGVPTGLEIAFKSEHAGKFANLYKSVDGKPVFAACAKLGADGRVFLPNVTEKGDYIAMLCEFSDLLGDMTNDGVLDIKDALETLRYSVGPKSGANPLMADFNGDGKVDIADASSILKRIFGLV